MPEPDAAIEIVIATMRPEGWDAVRVIYIEGIATVNSTFELRISRGGNAEADRLQ